jgi:recombination protein RecA
MPERRQIQPTVELDTGSRFVTSGSNLLDLVLGGGWAAGRIINLVGDKSTGKTLLAIEACANTSRLSNTEQVRYAEAEAAFDVAYAQTMGLPAGIEPVPGLETVEQVYDDLHSFLDRVNPKYPSIYVLDSLDALSDAQEMEREIDKGSYGASKARKLSEMFRRIVKPLERSNCTLFIVSQIRDKLNVTFGETKTRSGGRALDFYASQIIWLAEIEKIKRTVRGAERYTGLWVRANCRKNKLSVPFRSVDLAILFSYGVHDGLSMVDWLKTNKNTEDDWAAVEKQITALMKQGDRAALTELETRLTWTVSKHWRAIEEDLAPKLRKYT